MLGNPIDMANLGINYGSPTVNYTMGGMGNIPPYPIGNTTVGGMGYNQPPWIRSQQPPGYMGGYYNNGYSMPMNPYLVQKQEQARLAALREQSRMQSDIKKTISKIAHRAIGDTDKLGDIDEYLKQYDPKEEVEETEAKREEDIYIQLTKLVPVQPNYAYNSYCNAVSKSYKDRCPDNMGLSDFLDVAGELYIDALLDNIKDSNNDGKLRYNSDAYRNTLNSYGGGVSTYINSVLRGGGNGISNVNIDDMEIELPNGPGDSAKMVVNCPSYMQEYANRKALFLNTILNRNSAESVGEDK